MLTDNDNTNDTNAGEGTQDQNSTVLTGDNQNSSSDDGQSTNFVETLSIKDDLLKDFSDADSLAQAYLDRTKEFNEFKETVPNIPESPDKYTFEGEGNIDTDALDQFKQLAHENGIPLSAFQKIVEFDLARQQQYMEVVQQQEEQQINQLKDEWKNNFDTNIELARRAVKHFGGEGLETYLDESRLGNHPEMIKMFLKIQSLISEDALHTGDNNNTPKERPKMEDGKPMLTFPSMQK